MARFDFSGAVEVLEGARTVAVCGHVNPDGDCLGSVLATVLALRSLGYEATPLLASRDLPGLYDFLEGYGDFVPACEYKGDPDVFISVDVPTIERTGDGVHVKKRAAKSICIDHHQGEGAFADVAYVDEDAAAAGIIVWDFVEQIGAARTPQIAECCYTALVTDTGRFQFQNADKRAFAAAAAMVEAGAQPAEVARCVYQRRTMASLRLESLVIQRMAFACDGRVVLSWVTEQDFADLGAVKEDGERLIDSIRQVDGVEVAVMLREQGPIVRGSIRSKTTFDVSKIAEKFGGGGHKAASGFTFHGKIGPASLRVTKLLEQAFTKTAEGALR